MAGARPVDWPVATEAVSAAGRRVTELLRRAERPHAAAVGTWDATELAIHLSHSIDTATAIVQGGGNLLDDVWQLAALSGVMVAGEGSRSLPEAAERIEAGVAAFLAAAVQVGPEAQRDWLVTGTTLPVASLACQVLSELTVHGRDLARSQGEAWPTERTHAALAVEGFLFPSLGQLGRAVVDPATAGSARARFEVRVRGGGASWLRFHDGDLVVESEAGGPVDCHLSVDPAAFLLVAWGRLAQWPAIARGQLLAWGRRPWLGLRLRSWLRNP